MESKKNLSFFSNTPCGLIRFFYTQKGTPCLFYKRTQGHARSQYRRLRCITALLGLSSLSVSSMGHPFLKNILRILYTDMAHLSTGPPCIPLGILCNMHGILCKRAQPMAAPLWLSKKWLAPLFRGVHSSLAPTARPGSYAGKPLLRKAFCGFAVHAAKSD